MLALLSTITCAKTPSKEEIKLQNPSNEIIQIRLANTDELRSKGLSGLKPQDFKETEGMLFIFKKAKAQKFWMPDTYFNLDIMFLDKDLKIVGIEKNVQHHIGHKEPPPIYRTAYYYSQFVLETKAGAKFSKDLKIGDSLKWISTTSLLEIIRDTHP